MVFIKSKTRLCILGWMNDMPGRMLATDVACAMRCEPSLDVDAAHVWRSRIVEKCAEAERHILRLLHAAGATCTAKAPLSQKIEALKQALDDPPPSMRSNRLLPLLEKLRPLSDLRSELVHSTVSIADMEGETVAVFRSAAEPQEGVGERLIMTTARLKGLREDLSRVANGLKQEAGRT